MECRLMDKEEKEKRDKSYLEKFLADVEKLKQEREKKRNKSQEKDCSIKESHT